MLKIFNDMLLAADRGEVTALCMLDLTAAFDTVDHEVLLSKLNRMIGLSGIALTWYFLNTGQWSLDLWNIAVKYETLCSIFVKRWRFIGQVEGLDSLL